MNKKLTRRTFVKGAAGVLGAAALGKNTRAQSQESDASPVDAGVPLPTNVSRTWLGPAFWANRLQDWRLAPGGKIECVSGAAVDAVRTVALLTREMTEANAPAHLLVRATLVEGSAGFCGFLIGAGAGKLDGRAAALVHKASGIGGGMLCTFDADGRVVFREHTDEEKPVAFAPLPSEPSKGEATPHALGAEVTLRLDVLPSSNSAQKNGFDVSLSVFDAAGKTVAAATRRGVAGADVVGGISLVSSPAGNNGARWAFRDVRAGGAKIAVRDERALGPVLGTLYSVNETVLKLSAQFFPLAQTEPQTAQLQFGENGQWTNGLEATIGDGYVALFRVEKWDAAARPKAYRIVYNNKPVYEGVIRRDLKNEAGRPLVIGLFSCVLPAPVGFEGQPYKAVLPGETYDGRWSPANLYFPHQTLIRNARKSEPDLLVFSGDQLYEGNPTRKDQGTHPTLDYLYKWYLWLWAFRDLTKDTPTIVQVDDHDVFQGNIWGASGRSAPRGNIAAGGYVNDPGWVNLVQRTQCAHNPDPFDSAPIQQNIGVYYGSFRYGGVSFAILEDRKFKDGSEMDAARRDARNILGARQEAFLDTWGRDRRPDDIAKICLTQTVFACINTNAQGEGQQDSDSNGGPKPARDQAIRLLKNAGALILSGDQHLSSLIRHGLDTHTDAVVQFSSPAMGSQWQRWFEPAAPLSNSQGTPFTGDFVDGFGNKVRVLAVANPKISNAVFRAHHPGRNNNVADRNLKREGYGIVRVDKQARAFVLECWPHDADPMAGGKQFAGWPYRLAFDAVRTEERNA